MPKQKKPAVPAISKSDAEIICRDFMTFCDYVIEHKIKLSKTTGHIGKKDCFELNKMFYWKEDYVKAIKFQPDYPLIHFFYYTALQNKILELSPAGTRMVSGKNYTLFQNAPVMEQYTLLLLTFFYDANYMEQQTAPYHLTQFFFWVDQEKPEEGKTYSVPCYILRFSYSHRTVAACLEEFQLIRIDKKSLEKSKEKYTPLEIKILPALRTVSYLFETMSVREKELWDEDETDRICFEKYMEILEPARKEYILSELFTPEKVKIPEQTIDLKVSMRYHDCSRTIRMNLSDSLHKLHEMIQLAFDFDNDHLYEFYVGRKPFQKTFTTEYGVTSGDEYSSEETALGELELRKGQIFTYLFDFGDSWWFEIEVEKTTDGRIKEPQIIESENEAPEQYPMWDEDWDCDEDEYEEDEGREDEDYDVDQDEAFEEYEPVTKAETTVFSILKTIDDELIEDQYIILCNPKNGNADSISPDEQRRAIEQIVCQEPDKMLAFMTEEMSGILERMLSYGDFTQSELCQIAKLYSFGFCTFPEKDDFEIHVPECIRDIYAPKLIKKNKLPDQFTEISEILIRRCGVIEIEKLYSIVRKILRRKLEFEEYQFFIVSRLHYFGDYYMDSYDGTEYISRYDRELMEQILEERQKPENKKYCYPAFEKMKVKELREPLKEVEEWSNYIRFHLSIDPETAFWLMEVIPLLVSSGVIETEEIIEAYKNAVKTAGSRMSKKASEMIHKLVDTLPLATRFGNSASDEAEEEYQQLSLFNME